jgi:hypothetical protein
MFLGVDMPAKALICLVCEKTQSLKHPRKIKSQTGKFILARLVEAS